MGNLAINECYLHQKIYNELIDLIDFLKDKFNYSYITSGGNYCECLYSDQNIPAPPSGLDWYSVVNSFSGSGPISGSIGSPSNTACYTFTVREV